MTKFMRIPSLSLLWLLYYYAAVRMVDAGAVLPTDGTYFLTKLTDASGNNIPLQIANKYETYITPLDASFQYQLRILCAGGNNMWGPADFSSDTAIPPMEQIARTRMKPTETEDYILQVLEDLTTYTWTNNNQLTLNSASNGSIVIQWSQQQVNTESATSGGNKKKVNKNNKKKNRRRRKQANQKKLVRTRRHLRAVQRQE